MTERTRASVLLAEDDEEMRKLLARTLREQGLDVTEVPHGLALVDRLISGLESGAPAFDLVVSDVRMPGITGLSVLEGLTESEELRGQRMVLITGFGDPRVRALAKQFGAVSLLEKPFELAVLARVVREAIAGRA